MRKWQCTICSYIYDPVKGGPDNDFLIPPNTPFEALVDAWICPECGASKELFEELEG